MPIANTNPPSLPASRLAPQTTGSGSRCTTDDAVSLEQIDQWSQLVLRLAHHLATVDTDQQANARCDMPLRLLLLGNDLPNDNGGASIELVQHSLQQALQRHSYFMLDRQHLHKLSQLNVAHEQSYLLACVWLPQLAAAQLSDLLPVLTRCRDLWASHTLVVLPSELSLHAYGFSILKDTPLDTQAAVRVWQFNLYDYKQLPDWLNAKYWANPENWDKYRW